jgi:hypothetical protein
MFTIEWRSLQLMGGEPDGKSLSCKGRTNNSNNNNLHNYYYMKLRSSTDRKKRYTNAA